MYLFIVVWLSIHLATGRLPQFGRDGQAELAQAIADTLLHNGEEIPVDSLVELLGTEYELREYLIKQMEEEGVVEMRIYCRPINGEGLRSQSLITQANISRRDIEGKPDWKRIEKDSGEIAFVLRREDDLNAMSQALAKDYSGDGYEAYISAVVYYGIEIQSR